jgi:hypothetical protein
MHNLPQKKPRGRPRKTYDLSSESFPNLSAGQQKAIAVEIQRYTAHQEQGEIYFEIGGLPDAALAKKIGVSRQIVHRWRKTESYQQGRKRAFLAMCQRELSVPPEDLQPTATNAAINRLVVNKRRYIESFIRQTWNGPVESPIDNEIYGTEEEYIAHLLANDVLPHGLLKIEKERA